MWLEVCNSDPAGSVVQAGHPPLFSEVQIAQKAKRLGQGRQRLVFYLGGVLLPLCPLPRQRR